MAFSNTWNAAFEALPPDTGEAAALGASRIRDHKEAVRERMEIDHSWAGDADDGKHLKVTLPERSAPTLVADSGIIYTKDVAGATELYYMDDSGNEVLITAGGYIKVGSLSADAITDAQHGNKTTDTLHAAAVAGVSAGFISAADQTKLDGIESGATADQSAAEILAALLTVDGSGSGLDADLLDGQSGAYYLALGNATGTISAAQHAAQTSGTLHAAVIAGSTSGFMTGADKTKLDGIETGATQDQTAAEILTLIKTVDGSGSGLDADLLDGLSSAAFAVAAEGVTNGDSHDHSGGDGAAIPAGGIASSAISQAKLKTTTGSVTGGTGNYTLPGGTYGFYPQSKSNGVSLGVQIASGFTTTSFVTNVYISSGGGSHDVQQRYVQSSPPYDLGDGEVHGFIFVLLDSNGVPYGSYVAEDPPWYGNAGPGAPVVIDDVAYEYRKQFTRQDLIDKKCSIEEYLADGNWSYRGATMTDKLFGMDVVPHPFPGHDPAHKVIMLDGMDPKVRRLIALDQQGERAFDLLRGGYIKLDNTPLKRCGPTGINQHALKF